MLLGRAFIPHIMAEHISIHRFLDWAKHRAVSLGDGDEKLRQNAFEEIARSIGNARIVGLGESHHYTLEFNRFRGQLFKYLVQNSGFRVLVLECGLVEAKKAYDFVLGHDIPIDDVFINLNNNFGVLNEVQESLIWMRDYNRSCPENDKLAFYGMDGCEGWAGYRAAVDMACDYLDGIDPSGVEPLRTTLTSLASEMSLFKACGTERDQDEAIANLHRLMALFKINKLSYVSKTGNDAFQWAEMAASLACEVGNAVLEAKREPDRWLVHWNNLRDFSMAAQMNWIWQREGNTRGILMGAHNGHLQKCTNRETSTDLATFAQYLLEMIPEDNVYLISGTNYFSLRPNDPALPDSNQSLLNELDQEEFFLSIRDIGEEWAINNLLSDQRPDRANLHYQPLALAQAWDGIYFTRSIAVDEVIIPKSYRKTIRDLSEQYLQGVAGEYEFLGVFDFREFLTIEMVSGKLFTESPNSDGELFPAHRSELVAFSKHEFGWRDWPMTLVFERDERDCAIRGSVHFPTMPWTFYGERRQ